MSLNYVCNIILNAVSFLQICLIIKPIEVMLSVLIFEGIFTKLGIHLQMIVTDNQNFVNPTVVLDLYYILISGQFDSNAKPKVQVQRSEIFGILNSSFYGLK